jgi:hypothetical protein
MTIGRIGGPMLKENLVRQGVDLSVETNLLYFDVNNMRLGVNTATPNVAMDINGITRFSSNLQINGSNIATYAGNGNITLSPNGTGKLKVSYLTATRIPYVGTGSTIQDSANLTFDGTTLSTTGILLSNSASLTVGNLQLFGNSISSTNINGDIILDPQGTGTVIFETVNVSSNRVLYTGTNKEVTTNANLTFDGTTLALTGNANVTTLNIDILSSLTTNGNITLNPNGTGNVLLDTASANTVVYAGSNKELLTNSNLQFDGTTLKIGNITASGNTISSSSGNINITPSGSNRVVFEATNSIRVPVGDTSQRPSPTAGDFRFNTEFNLLEFYTGSLWQTVAADVSYNISDTFNGDGSTAVFTLSQPTTSSGAFVALNGVIQSPAVAYGISGTTLTFTEAPAVGDRIDIRYISLANELSLYKIEDAGTKVVVDNPTKLVSILVNNSLKLQVSETDVKINGNFSTTVPITKTADFTLADSENFVINNKSGSACVVTLPSAASYPGRQITFKNLVNQFLDSASSNVCPIDSATPGIEILSANSGKWATIVSDGTNWIIMAAN